MSQSFQDADVRDTLGASNSTFPYTYNALRGVVYAPSRRGQLDVEAFYGYYRVHKSMVAGSGSGTETVQPVCYVRFQRYSTSTTINSSSDIGMLAREYYDRIESQLLMLSKSESDVRVVEEGAARTALTVIDQLKKNQIAPPEISWHGGDAVVMLWVLGDTTYAITVTDGELGYVARRNKKAIKMADSISLDAFRLSDLR